MMERRNGRFAASTPSRVDTSEPQVGGSAGQQASRQATAGDDAPAAMGDMSVAILSLTTQIRQLVLQCEAGGGPGSTFDPPPPYA